MYEKIVNNVKNKMDELVKNKIIPWFGFWYDRDGSDIVRAIDALAKKSGAWIPENVVSTIKRSAEDMIARCNNIENINNSNVNPK